MRANLLKYLILTIILLCGNQIYAKVYLVSVGIADYSGFPAAKVNNLVLTAEDAKTIATIYAKNGRVDYALLLNDKATKANIVYAIKKVFSKAGADDIVVFFFSGHGYKGGLCCYNDVLSYKEVRDAMAKSKSKNKMMFVDACKSGGMRVKTKTNDNSEADARKANVMLFLSSRTNENSGERLDMQNGFFTTYLKKGLLGNADVNHDRIITAKELFTFVHHGVTKISGGRQHPVMWGSFDDNMPVMKR